MLRVKGESFTVVLDQKHRLYLFIFLNVRFVVKREKTRSWENAKQRVDIVQILLLFVQTAAALYLTNVSEMNITIVLIWERLNLLKA